MFWLTAWKSMGSTVADSSRRPGLFTPQMWLLVWLPTVAITTLHYATGPELHWLHDVLRRLYYLPILLAAFSAGLRGGVAAALLVVAAYAPHAFTHLAHQDPAHTLEKVLELVLYLVVGGVSGTLVDRERRRMVQLQAALEEQRATADQLVRAGRLAALGELVAGIAHEIKNPLHALQGTAEVVQEAIQQDAPQARMWELHRAELDRLGQVADRFLSFARPTAPDRHTCDLGEVVEGTRELLAAQARQQGVEVQPRRDEEEAAEVKADAGQLTQVLLNIGLNALSAIHASGQGGKVGYALSSGHRGGTDYWVVTVENDGPPIPEDDLERIFDPFVTTKEQGVGLGLSIASRIVEQHGGFIEVRNRTQGGVAFEVFLPT